MNPRRINPHVLKVSLKIGLAVLCYLAFAIYTVPAYKNIRVYADEKLISNKKYIIMGDSAVLVDVVKTEEERALGLSGKENLLDHTGMLFVFERPDKYGIWMKDMKFDIDIIWFNEYGEIIYFFENVTPASYPKTFTPPQDSLYILEVPAGFVKREGLKIGDKIDLY